MCQAMCVSIGKHQGESDGLVLGICLREQTEARRYWPAGCPMFFTVGEPS